MFTQNELIIMIGVVSVLLICITILTILDIKEYLKAKKGLVEEEMDFGPEYQEEEKKLEPIQMIEVEDNQELEVNTIASEKTTNDEIFLEEMEDEKFNNKEVVSPLIQEVEEESKPIIEEVKEEVITPKVDIKKEELVEPILEKKEKKKLELFEELDEIEENLPNKKDDVTNFEMEQERTAIISLDELLQKSNELYSDNEYVQYDDGNEPISIDEVISRFRQESEPVKKEISEETKEIPVVMQAIEEKVEPYSKKETIPFISSVYGIERQNNALEFENTANYEKLDREKYNDFVAKLREMKEKE